MSPKTVEDIIAANTARMAVEQEIEDLEQMLCEIFAQVAEEQRGEQLRKQRAAEWAAEIPQEWTDAVEQRVQQEIAEWEAAGQPAVSDE